MPDPMRNSIAFRAGAIALSLPTIIPVVEGLAQFERLEAGRTAAVDSGRWAIAYAPPIWLQALFLAAAVGLGLFLAWRASHQRAGRRIAVLVLLLCASQSVFFNTDVWTVWGLDWWSANLQPEWPRWLTLAYLRTLRVVDLFWPPFWFFAAATFVGFSLWFPNGLTANELLTNRDAGEMAGRRWWRSRTARLRPLGTIEAGLTVAGSSWLILYQASHGYAWYPVLGGLIAVAILGWALNQRESSDRFADASSAPGDGVPPRVTRPAARPLLIFAGCIALTALAPSTALIAFWLGLVLALLRGRQIAAVAPRAVWVVPAGLAIAVVVGRQPIWYAMPWLGVALFDGLRFLRLNFAAASRGERLRILWAHTGFVTSASIAVLFASTVTLGEILDCVGPGPGVFCRVVAVQDWMLLLPLPTLTFFLAVAVFYSGAVDSGLVLRRTAVSSGIVILLIFTFGVIEHVLSAAFSTRLPDGTATVAAAGTIALAMHPVKNLCERGVLAMFRALTGNGEPQT